MLASLATSQFKIFTGRLFIRGTIRNQPGAVLISETTPTRNYLAACSL